MRAGKILWAVSCAVLMASGLLAQGIYSGDVLFVYAGTFPSDSAIVAQLTYMGFNVTTVTDAACTAGDADGKKFVYVSSTCSSGQVAGKFKEATIPVLIMEGKATDEMGMTLPNPGSDPVTQSTTDVPIRDIEIMDEGNYLAAGLTGVIQWSADTTLYSHEMVPGGDAIVIGEYVRKEGDVGRIYGAMFSYEKDDELADGTFAAGRRYFAVWYDSGFLKLTGDGYKLWLAMINWACGWDTETAVPEVPVKAPSGWRLSQNYPNPFNPSTTIPFSIPTKACVQINLYNIAGQKIAVLKDERMDAGMHEVRFEMKGHASGVYVLELRADAEILTRKITLMQ